MAMLLLNDTELNGTCCPGQNMTPNISTLSSISFDQRFSLGNQVRISLYSVIFFLSVVGNVLVIVTLVQNKRMRTVTNVFLLNLAVSDFLLGVFCMPFTLVGTLLREFIFGEAMCKAIPYLQAVSVSVSAWTLVAISLERYFAICQPLRSRRWQTLSHAYKTIAIVWIASLACMLPIAILSQLLPTRKVGKFKCREIWASSAGEKSFTLFVDIFLLLIPLLTMTFAYALISSTLWKGMHSDFNRLKSAMSKSTSANDKLLQNNGFSHWSSAQQGSIRSLHDRPPTPRHHSDVNQAIRSNNAHRSLIAKQRIIRMLFVLVLEFFVCWTPLYVVNTLSLFEPQLIYNRLGSMGISLVQLLAYVSCCCNPITYCFMHQKFRKAFLAVFNCRRRSYWVRGSEISENDTSFSLTRQTTLRSSGTVRFVVPYKYNQV